MLLDEKIKSNFKTAVDEEFYDKMYAIVSYIFSYFINSEQVYNFSLIRVLFYEGDIRKLSEIQHSVYFPQMTDDIIFICKHKTFTFSFCPQSQNASPKQRKQSVYTPPTMKGTVQVLFRDVVSVEFIAGRLSVLKDCMLVNNIELVSLTY